MDTLPRLALSNDLGPVAQGIVSANHCLITLFQEGDIYITIVNHDGPRKERKLNQHYSNH